MDGFRVDCGKLDVQCGTLENYETLMQEMIENINSVCTGLRHKLSAMDDIGSNLKKIEENLKSETVIMANMREALVTVISNYRKTEGTITGFKEDIAPEKTGTTQSEEMKPFGIRAGVPLGKEGGFGNDQSVEKNAERHKFDGTALVIDKNGHPIGYCDEDGYVTDYLNGFRIGGYVDEHGIYYDEKGKVRGKREDSYLDICGDIIDFGGYREELEYSKRKDMENSDLIFVEWKKYLNSMKSAVSDSLHSWGVPKVFSD